MPIQGVNRLLYFKRGANRVLTPAEFESDPLYGFEPDGINFYYGINDYNVEKRGQTGRALNFGQREFFEGSDGQGGAAGFALNSANPRHPEHFNLLSYWPGDDVVDYVSATWYADGQGALRAAAGYFKSYFLQFEAHGKPLGIDEIGGKDNGSNNAMLHRMVDEIRALTA